jgi:vancomycin permeability regulator SanA
MLYRTVLLILLLLPAAAILPRLLTALFAQPRIHPVAETPEQPAAIVFGAGLWRDGSPTPVLRDRVSTGAQLYFAGKVQKLLMSGGQPSGRYNEPEAMRAYALSLGVPDEAIILDYAGDRTYDTCYRARHIFGLTRAALVTQQFHLPRALYLCNRLGIQATGVSADLREYRRRSLFFWNLREIPATLTAFWDVHIARPQPVLGAPEPIFPLEAQ